MRDGLLTRGLGEAGKAALLLFAALLALMAVASVLLWGRV
jgi:hypothetical protein